MLSEVRQRRVAVKLVAIVALLALTLGFICARADQAYATHENPEIYKMEATVDAPIVGEAPTEKLEIVLSRQDKTELPDNEYGKVLSWYEVGSATKPEQFEADKTYGVTCQATYYHWDGSYSECPGVAATAEGYVNGKPSTNKPSVEHYSPSEIHFIYVACTWTLHEVTFDSNGGTGDMAAQTVYEGEKTKLGKNKFANVNRKFAGWNTKKDGSGTAYADEAEVDLTASTTLYAQWAPETYKVTVKADPTKGGDASADKKEAAAGETVTLSATPAEGYELAEWASATPGVAIKDGKFTMPGSDVEVTATFKEKSAPVTKCTVSFDANGGEGSMDPVEGEKGSTVELPASKFTHSGYSFKGWNTVADGSGKAYADKAEVKVEGDMKLYAQWTEGKPASDVAMHRLYNPWSYEHFYTSDDGEFELLVTLGWTDEGTGWVSPAESDTPVYRLYNPYNGGDHHYTTSTEERDTLIAEGWIDEEVAWYSADESGTPVYREYNPNELARNHNYTTDKDEHDGLVALGWHDEEIAWYGVPSNDSGLQAASL